MEIIISSMIIIAGIIFRYFFKAQCGFSTYITASIKKGFLIIIENIMKNIVKKRVIF